MKFRVNPNNGVIAILFTVLYFALFWIVAASLSKMASTIIYYALVLYAAIAMAYVGEINSKNGYRKASLIFILASFGILFFIFAFRDSTAIDDVSYMTYFYWARTLGYIKGALITGAEIGYCVILYIVGLFTDDYLYVQIVTAAIPLIIMMISIYENRARMNWPISVFLFIVFFYFVMLAANLSRMFIAYSIMFYGIKYALDNETKKYSICLALAFTFHHSSIIMAIFLYLSLKSKTIRQKKRYCVLLYITLPVAIFIFIRFFAVFTRYSAYANVNWNFSGMFSRFTRLPLSALLFLGIGLIKRKGRVDNAEIQKLVMMEYMYGFATVIKLCSIFADVARLVYYFDAIFIIGFSMVYKRLTSIGYKALMIMLLVSYGIFYLYRVDFAGASGYALFPYQNIFFTR